MLHDLYSDRTAVAVVVYSTGRLQLTMLAEAAERVMAEKEMHRPAAAWLVVLRVLVQETW